MFTTSSEQHKSYLLACLKIAEQGKGACSPNPAVGAILVKNGDIIASGYHAKAGLSHAEIVALEMAGNEARGADLYVSLEPCGHWGKTPPCADSIIQAGISAVYYAYQDPNPEVTHTGLSRLIDAGIPCHYLPLEEAKTFYRSYQFWQKYHRPWVTVKIALSLDGKIAGINGQPIHMTGTETLKQTHRSRLLTDAILTTAKTVLADDPQLNARIDQTITSKQIYILDRHLSLKGELKIYQSAKSITVFHQEDVDVARLAAYRGRGIKTISCPLNENHLDLQFIMDQIGQDGIHDLWVEAGGILFENLVNEKLIHVARFYIAPIILGEHALPAFRLPLNFRDVNNIKLLATDDLCYEVEFFKETLCLQD